MNSLTRIAARLRLRGLPLRAERSVSRAIGDTTDTPLGRATERLERLHPHRSGVLALADGHDAFATRMLLAEAAECSLDVQYYIWHADLTGTLLMRALYRAAERGVRVRLLLDDNNTRGMDASLWALDSHPNVEVRLFNPFVQRDWRWLGYLTDFSRLNRRMHNKSFTVDGAVTIVGGRNIGNEYFDLDPVKNFRDREILVVGPVVADVAAGFEAFWMSPWTALASSLAGDALSPEQRAAARDQLGAAAPELRALGYAPRAARADAGRYATGLLSRLLWAPAQLVLDMPPDREAMDDASRPQAVAQALERLTMSAQREILLESAYLILNDGSLSEWAELTARGVSIRALTNSLASNDLVTNHSGYARHRKAMLESGMKLFELRPDAGACQRLIAATGGCTEGREFSLHSKSLVLDRRIVYVGSFNINLRSTYLNSETALIIDSPVLARQIAESIEELMAPDSSWQVLRSASGGLEWRTETASGPVLATHEPMTGFWRRVESRVYRLFPMEKYL